ncbi:hypothetical protein [Mycolicibacterium mengxianglii]|uniref:hypothetical protein n=1 Tax=Mycolicibacterium mengxianglii TaxID=2736649 RepID=UPI0018D00A78|nr:hypothetical protein [Mycolicibacterium mengxianglii]
MNKFGFATITATALTAGFFGLAAPAMAAPSGAGSAQDTISSLQDQGYKVVVNRLSNAPLSQATVVSVGEGASFTHTDTNAKNTQDYTGDDRFAPVTTRTVYVNVR